jgi:DNA-binding NarL/FixJ family response regulator
VIAVALVDDHPVMRLGLAQLIRSTADLDLVAEVACVEDLDPARQADVVLLDWQLDGCGLSGLDAVRHLVARGLRVLTYSGQASREDILDAMAAGATGYVTKGGEGEELVEAVRLAACGSSYVSATVAGELRAADQLEPRSEGTALTPREDEILSLLASGCTYKEVARELEISFGTVRKHVDNIRDKWQERRLAVLLLRWSEQRRRPDGAARNGPNGG